MTRYVYVGSETWSEGKHRPDSIYVYQMQPDGKLDLIQSVEGGENPSFLAIAPNKRFMYCINERREGMVTAFSVDSATGKLTVLNSALERAGLGPCYISIDPTGKWAFVANYGGGSVNVMKLLPDGRVEAGMDSVQHEGSGTRADRQEGPHAHSILPAPGGEYVLSADLGTNKIYIYHLEEQFGVLAAHESAMAAPGAGPRHMAFHPLGLPYLYVSNELDNTVAVYQWGAQEGKLSPRGAYPTLPEDFKEENLLADLHLSPDGKFLYTSNRGHDSLAVYRISEDGAQLEFRGRVPTEGHWPRNFCLDAEGRLLLVANQESSNLVLYRLNPETGMPEPTGQKTDVIRPMFVTIVDF